MSLALLDSAHEDRGQHVGVESVVVGVLARVPHGHSFSGCLTIKVKISIVACCWNRFLSLTSSIGIVQLVSKGRYYLNR